MNAFTSSPVIVHTDEHNEPSTYAPRTSLEAARQNNNGPSVPRALVLSGDDSIRFAIGEILARSDLSPVFATTLKRAAHYVASGNLNLCICQDRLPDGRYQDLLLLKYFARSSAPLIVISRSGDWPEYLAALEFGAYDFLAYPLIPGELQRIIRRFLDRQERCHAVGSDYFG